jgi:hypothetical protein
VRSLAYCVFLLSSIALANAPGYDLSLGAEARDGTLKVAPIVTAPAGTKLRYDVSTTRIGRSGNSNSRQSGNVTVGDDGKATLSQVAVSVSPQDQFVVHVEVYDGAQVVASKILRHPQ